MAKRKTANGGKVRMKAWRGWCLVRTRNGLNVAGVGSRRYVFAHYTKKYPKSFRIARVEIRELPRRAVK